MEEPAGGVRALARWLLLGVMAGAVGLAAWHTLGSEGSGDKPTMGKFDQLLARHTPQRMPQATTPDSVPQPPMPAAFAEAPSPVAEPSQPTVDTIPAIAHDETLDEEAVENASARALDTVTDDPDSPLPQQPGGYNIQVASLRSKERAELLVAKLQRDGHHARREAVGLRGRGGWWHTVKIGPFDTRIDAETYRLTFDPFQGHNAVVLPRSNGEFHVQAASLRSREKAEELVKSLKRRGHHARRKQVRVRGRGEWHTVKIGPFDTRAEAEAYRAHFVKVEQKTAVVVPFERLAP